MASGRPDRMSGTMRRALTVSLIAGGCFFSAATYAEGFQTPADLAFNAHMQPTVQRISMQAWPAAGGMTLRNTQALTELYQRNGYQALWSNPDHWHPAALHLRAYLEQLPSHGLDPDSYHYTALRLDPSKLNLASRIEQDLLLSDSFLSLSNDFSATETGPQATWVALPWLLRLQPSDDPTVLLDTLLPQHPDYWALSQALQSLLLQASPDPFATLDTTASLQLGHWGSKVEALSQRLAWLGAYQGPTSDVFNEALRQALIRYQRSHGLNADGIAGPATLAALNTTDAQRIERISVNLERWRQSSRDWGDSHVRVNIAAQEMEYVHRGRTELSMKVIVGKNDRQTPTTSGTIEYLVVNPYWNVPRRIAIDDKLPLIKSNPGYLERHGFTVSTQAGERARPLDPDSINWQDLNRENFPYYLRQSPGQNNALGRVKFMFPNNYSVYLHGTPSRHLFNREERFFSSGCVRLAEPMSLARLMLRNHGPRGRSADWDFSSNATQRIFLAEPIPVHLQYWTAWVDRQGRVQYRQDAYHRDQPILAQLIRSGRYSSADRLLAFARGPVNQLASR